MKYIKFLLIGILFGIIGSTVVIEVIMIQFIKYKQLRSIYGEKIQFQPKEKGVTRYLLDGIIFGFGWALTVSCPGPMFTLVGKRFSIILVSVASAILGSYT